MHFIGLDLTDGYARCPREVDVALVDSHGRCTFECLPAWTGRGDVSNWLASLTAGPASGDVLVLDGPLGLARTGSSTRRCEAQLRAPGHTPDVLPRPGSGPFAGYIRGAVELSWALVAAGWVPMWSGTAPAAANLLEAYPGGTWPRLAGGRLDSKTTETGRSARENLLSQAGLTFVRRPTSHDQLDAALCAWLGWMLHRDPASVEPVGERLFRDGAVLREGVILQAARGPEGPFVRPSVPSSPGATALRRSDPERGGVQVPDVVPVDCQWVYFATPARADRWETAELAMDEGLICRPAHNRNGSLIANVRHVQPGDVLLLVYSDQGECEIIGAFGVLEPDQPVEAAPAVQMLTDPRVSRRLAASGYAVDPWVGGYTAFLVAPLWTPDRRCSMSRPAGNNALWRVAAPGLPSFGR